MQESKSIMTMTWTVHPIQSPVGKTFSSLSQSRSLAHAAPYPPGKSEVVFDYGPGANPRNVFHLRVWGHFCGAEDLETEGWAPELLQAYVNQTLHTPFDKLSWYPHHRQAKWNARCTTQSTKTYQNFSHNTFSCAPQHHLCLRWPIQLPATGEFVAQRPPADASPPQARCSSCEGLGAINPNILWFLPKGWHLLQGQGTWNFPTWTSTIRSGHGRTGIYNLQGFYSKA